MSEEAVFGESERVMQDSRVRSDAYHSSLITHHSSRRGFTLVEMLTVIGIIVLLVSILLPVVSAVRVKGHVADTQAMLARIAAGIESYNADFHAYPGPLHNGQIYGGGMTLDIVDSQGRALDKAKVTQSENLVLGLLGGLIYKDGKLTYDDTQVGNGPVSLNLKSPKKGRAYMDKVSLSEGDFKDEAGDADDTIIREFVDRFPSPMPILYMRANVGATGIASADKPITQQEQYDLKQIKAYTLVEPGKMIGVGKEAPSDDEFRPQPAPTTDHDKVRHGLREVKPNGTIQNPPPPGQTYSYPYDLYGFMRHPSMTNVPRQQNGYILISAGADRIYGTRDDAVYPASR